MSIEEHVHTRLTGYAGLSTLVGSKVYAQEIPQDTTEPACAYQVISKNYTPAMGANADVKRIRLQVTGFAVDYKSMKALELQIINALDRYSGTENSVTVDAAFFDGATDFFDSDFGIHQTNVDFIIHYR